MSTDDKDDDFQELYMDVIQSVSDQEVLSKVWKIGSRESLEDFIQRLQTEQETRRKPEDKSAGSYFQSFCVRISKFLEMYAGIADVVKSFDQRVGALAYGSLSILVTVNMFHQKHISFIANMIGGPEQKGQRRNNCIESCRHYSMVGRS
jgi:hypothetical protein